MAPVKMRPPVIGSFEDIGKDVAREVVKAPTDIAGKILESLTGASSTKGQQGQPVGKGEGKDDGGVAYGGGAPKKPDGALGTMEETQDRKVKKAIARAALEQLAGHGEKPAPSIFEEKQKEEEEKKAMEKKQMEKVAFSEIPHVATKKRRGDLYGIKGKSSTEMSKNVRQD